MGPAGKIFMGLGNQTRAILRNFCSNSLLTASNLDPPHHWFVLIILMSKVSSPTSIYLTFTRETRPMRTGITSLAWLK